MNIKAKKNSTGGIVSLVLFAFAQLNIMAVCNYHYFMFPQIFYCIKKFFYVKAKWSDASFSDTPHV